MSNFDDISQVLLAPRVTEKSTLCQIAGNQVVFRVALGSNKRQVRAAVEKMFSVNVEAVQTARVQGKRKRFGKVAGRRKDWKKAVVRLKEGQTIDFFENS